MAALARCERALPKVKKVEAAFEHMGDASGTAWVDGRGRVRKMILTLYGERGRRTERHCLDEGEGRTLIWTQYERYREQVGADTSVVSTEWCLFRLADGAAGDGTCVDDVGHRRSRAAADGATLGPEVLQEFHDAVVAQQIDRIARTRGAELAVEFKVVAIAPTFPIDDMPEGHHRWRLTIEVLACPVGDCIVEPVGSQFDVDIEIYFGPVRSRPAGLWVNEQPPAGSVWVAFFRGASQSMKPLFVGRAEQALLTIARQELMKP
jgi:hypothetical protein